MKILVTGLCFSGNLGGPALALSLQQGILKRVREAEIVFAVTNDPVDISAAAHYGCNAIGTPNSSTLKRLRIPWIVYAAVTAVTGRCSLLTSRYNELSAMCTAWHEALQVADAVVNLSGIAFVGDGMRDPSIAREELFAFEQAHVYGKPYARFIQSFGPFHDKAVAAYASRELKSLHQIYARGESTASDTRTLMPDAKVEVYPDCAISLTNSGKIWRSSFLEEHDIPNSDYIVVSPSSVIANTNSDQHSNLAANYVTGLSEVLKELVQDNNHIVLLPHAYFPSRAEACDLEVCRTVLRLLPDQFAKNVHLMATPLDACQAKAIIAGAKLAIVSRYHAAIAALSTATPVIALGWNQKYRDILEMYGMEDMAIDVRGLSPQAMVDRINRSILYWREGIESKTALLQSAHSRNIARLDMAFDCICEWLLAAAQPDIARAA